MCAAVNGVDPKPETPKQNGPSSNPYTLNSKTDSLADLEPDSEPPSSVEDAKNTGIKFAKTFLLVLPIYVLGYFEFSFSWILVGLAVLFWLKRNQGTRFQQVNRALAFFEHEEKEIRQTLPTSELPPWVHFPDVERVEWLNKTVLQMWPYICQFVDKLFRDTIEPAVKGANAHLSSFCFSKIDMGDKPLRINGVKVYTENVDKRQIIMDLQISFVGNTEIDVEIRKYYCKAGIKSIQLHGVLRVIMEPLLGNMPLIGALSVFFLKKPVRDTCTRTDLSDGIIEDIICSYLVLPNRITIPLVGNEEILAQLRFPVPMGVLRVHFLEAQDLIAKDTYLGGLIKGKSDPYGVIKIGNQLFHSKVIKDCLNPKWNEVFEGLVYDQPEQNLQIELYDEDPDEDDFLGRQNVQFWFVLDEVTSGKLHLKMEWLTLLSTPDKIDQVLCNIRADRGQANDGLSSALLLVNLDSAKNLPSAKKVSSDPSPLVQFRVGSKTAESKIRYKTNEPVWEETFVFHVHNPKTQELEVEVKDEKHECSLGTLTVPLTELLEAENMSLSQRFPLKSAGPSATLKMKLVLKVLSLEKSLASDHLSSLQVRNQAANAIPNASNSNLPQKTSNSKNTPKPSNSAVSPKPPSQLPSSIPEPAQPIPERTPLLEPKLNSTQVEDSPVCLAHIGRSSSNLAISGSQLHLNSKEPTPSIASDISNPYAAQELQHRLQELHNGSSTSYYPLGEVQLTVRHSLQRNKLIVVVHSCRNLIAFSDSGSDPYVRLYLLPDKRRSGRRKTSTVKKTLNPVYDQTFEFSVSLVELHKRTLDIAVKNGGGILSKHKGLLGKVLVDLSSVDISKSVTQW
uniref:Extended synaptotagmin-2 n=1 Tax=Electrophorus electricus TaxID=8005 RepID=A0A4W4FNT8_ELEEL